MEGGTAGGGRGQRRAGPLKGRAEVVKVIAGRGSDVVVVHSSGGEAAVTVAESVRVKQGRAVRRGVAGSLLEESGRAERGRATGVGPGPGAAALGGTEVGAGRAGPWTTRSQLWDAGRGQRRAGPLKGRAKVVELLREGAAMS